MTWRISQTIPKTTLFTLGLWILLAIVLLLTLAGIEKRYDLPEAWFTLARAAVVILIGLRIIWHIEQALSKNHAAAVQPIGALWYQSVTGLYITRLIAYSALVIATIFAVGGSLSGFLVGGTLLSVMLGVAGQSFFSNFFGGLAIALFKPFEIGDHIQLITPQLPFLPETYAHGSKVPGYQGVITDINLFYTSMRLDDGQLLRLANGIVINAGLLKKQPNEWLRMSFRFDVDPHLDIEVLLEQLSQLARQYFDTQPAAPIEPAQAALFNDEDALGNTSAPQAPQVAVVDLGLQSTSIQVRAWAPVDESSQRKQAFLRAAIPYLRPHT